MEPRSPGYRPLPSSDLEAQESGVEPQDRPSGSSFVSAWGPAAGPSGYIRMRVMKVYAPHLMTLPCVPDINIVSCLQAPHTHAHSGGAGSAARVRWKRGAAKAILAQALLSRPHGGPGAAQVGLQLHAGWGIRACSTIAAALSNHAALRVSTSSVTRGTTCPTSSALTSRSRSWTTPQTRPNSTAP